MLKITFISIVILLITHSVEAGNTNQIQTGRFSTVINQPPAEQLNPLRVTIKTSIPQGVKTVGEAIEYLLVRSGYSLIEPEGMGIDVQQLMELDLPQVHRKLGPITLDIALNTLSGEGYDLIVDPVHRKISFILTSDIQKVIQ